MTTDPATLPQTAEPPVVLASTSAIRAHLLRAAGVRIDTLGAGIDEAALKEALRAEQVAAAEAAVALAEMKAQRVAGRLGGQIIVLGCDQLLTCEDEWFDKPGDMAEARAQLQRLRGKRQELTSAVVAFRNGVRVWHHVEAARIWLRDFSDDWLDAYLAAAGDTVLTSVGAAQFEGLGAQLAARVQGEHSTILGLPVLPVLQFLRDQRVLGE